VGVGATVVDVGGTTVVDGVDDATTVVEVVGETEFTVVPW
jgi:hypothetical protein